LTPQQQPETEAEGVPRGNPGAVAQLAARAAAATELMATRAAAAMEQAAVPTEPVAAAERPSVVVAALPEVAESH